MNWKTQLISHGLGRFYKHGSCTCGAIIFDWIEETTKIVLDDEIKKICWRRAKTDFAIHYPRFKNEEQSKEIKVNLYKHHLVNEYLRKLQSENITVSIDAKPIKIKA